ncbi:peptide chain release factor N(5)-glutamine methyltransferase [Betaproteobacteria bacterium]|nr:peptide chain release factor N(5)-glutamine methyltransferase [Betaproteobacteria bacterium]
MHDAKYNIYIRRLISHIAQKPEYWYLAYPCEELPNETCYAVLSESLKKLDMGIPFEYVIGWSEFYKYRFQVTENVLIPREETEILVEQSINALSRSIKNNLKVLELGVGSGAIIASILLSTSKSISAIATDCSPGAILAAKNNSIRLGVNVAFKLGDWWDALNSEEDGPFDLIIANPPYVGTEKTNEKDTLSSYEPSISLYGKKPSQSGTNDAMKIISGASDWLEDGGKLLMEHGFNQRKILSDFAISNGLLILEQIDDLSGLPRVLILGK